MDETVKSEIKSFKPPTDGFIWGADVFPEDENFITLQLMYTEDVEKTGHTNRRFFIKRDDARLLAKMISEILAAPDAQTAWHNIAVQQAHRDPDFDDIPEPTPEEQFDSDVAVGEIMGTISKNPGHTMRVSAKLDHSAPRKRCSAAE